MRITDRRNPRTRPRCGNGERWISGYLVVVKPVPGWYGCAVQHREQSAEPATESYTHAALTHAWGRMRSLPGQYTGSGASDRCQIGTVRWPLPCDIPEVCHTGCVLPDQHACSAGESSAPLCWPQLARLPAAHLPHRDAIPPPAAPRAHAG